MQLIDGAVSTLLPCVSSAAESVEWNSFSMPSDYVFEVDHPEGNRFERECVLRRVFAMAQLTLGERMAALGIDEDGICEKILAIDEALAKPSRKPMAKRMRAHRSNLLRRLADAALEFDAPLPGADDEFAKALSAKRELEVFLHSDGLEMCESNSVA